MAVQRRVNWVSQQRVDLPDLRSIESAASNDFDQLFQTVYFQGHSGYILAGFNISMAGLIGGAASAAQMEVASAAILHPLSSQSGTLMYVPASTPPQILNSATNTIIQGAFTPNSLNYVGIDYERIVDDSTASQVYLWDPTINDETTSIIPRAQILIYNIFITNTTWAPNVLPICIITTDAGNNVLSVEDTRPLLFRLGTAGTTTPNPFYSYPWDAQPEGRTESPFISSSNSVDPFAGGDKMLFTEKDWKDAIMSVIKEIKGSAFWYSSGSSLVPTINLTDLFLDANATVITMRGKFISSQATPGELIWSGDINIRSVVSPLTYTIPAGNVTLADTQVAFISLVREQVFQPSNTFTFLNGSTTVTGATLISGIFAGDWILFFSDSVADYAQVQSVSGSSIVLTSPYTGTSGTGTALRAQGTYTMEIADPDDVPVSGNTFWIAKRDDNGTISATIAAAPTGAVRVNGTTTFTTTLAQNLNAGQSVQIAGVTDTSFNGFYEIITTPTTSSFTVDNPGPDATSGSGTVNSTATIYLRGVGAISQGESISDDDSTIEAILQYIGSPGPTATQPQYRSTNIVTQGIDLTDAIGELDAAAGTAAAVANQDRNIKLVEGGTWAFVGASKTLSWSATAYVEIPDLALTSNTINAGSITFTNDGDVAWIEVNRTLNTPTVITVSVGPVSSMPLDANTVIIARYFAGPPANVIVGNSSFTLADGQAAIIEGAIPLINDFFAQLRMSAVSPTPNTRILISNSDIVMPTGETRSQRISSFLLTFGGSQIDFQTGNVYEADGVTSLGINFTPVIPAAGMWHWFSIAVIPDSVGGNNLMSGQILVLAAQADGASMAAAPRATFAGSGITLGQVAITSVDGTTVTAISQDNIVQLGVGSGSGSGSGTAIKVDLYDPIDSSLPTVGPVVIDNVTIATGDTVLFSNLGSGNNEIYEATVTGSGGSATLPNPLQMAIQNTNPYSGGVAETVISGTATPQPANDAYFQIDGMSGGGGGIDAIVAQYTGTGSAGGVTNSTQFSQPFTPTSSGDLLSVNLQLTGVGSTAGTFNVGIYTDSAGSPGTLISNLATINVSSITTGGPNPYTFNFTMGSVVAGTQYHIVTSTSTNSSTVDVGISNFPTISANPGILLSSNGGSTWASFGGGAYNYTFQLEVSDASSEVASYVTTSNGMIFTSSTDLGSQPFIPSISGTITGATVTLSNSGFGNTSGNISFGIFTDNSGVPGTLISNVVLLDSATITGGPTNFPLAFTTAALVAGTQYHLVLNSSAVTFGSASWFWDAHNTSPTNPSVLFSSNSGSSWGAFLGGSYNGGFSINVSGVDAGFYHGTGSQGNFVNTSFAWSQPFISTATGALSGGDFEGFFSFSGSTGNWQIAIYTDNAGVPGTLVSNVATYNVSGLTGSPTLIPVVFTSGSLVAGTTYHFVINGFVISYGSGEPSIVRGTTSLTQTAALITTNGGSTWSSSPGGNLYFDVYVEGGGGGSFIVANSLVDNAVDTVTVNTQDIGQTFTASASGTVTDAIFMLSLQNVSPSLAGTISVSLYTDSAGQPGTLLATSNTIAASTLTNTPTPITFTFGSPPSVTSASVYHAIINTNGITGTPSSQTVSWEPQPDFSTPYTPTDGDMVVILQGLQFANQVALFDGTSWLINNTVRYFNGIDFWEQSSIITSSAVNNTSTTIFSVTALGSENIIIDFSILRNGIKETGTAWLTNNGTVAQVTTGGAYTGATGVSFSAAISGSNVEWIATLDNSGMDATIKYSIKRWSDGGAGPTGLPSYSPILPAGSTSAFCISNSSGTPYNCSNPTIVGGNSNVALNFTYTPGLNSGSTVGQLGVYVNGQRIPRFVSSLVTPPGTGTYYTEPDNMHIQFSANLSSFAYTIEIVDEV